MAYLYQGRMELVPREAGLAVALDPNEKDGTILQAIYHQWNGEYEQSQNLLQALLARDPLFFPARANYGENLRQMGDPSASIREQEKVLEQDPRLIFPLMYLVMAHMTAGHIAEARETLNKALTFEPQNYQVRLFLALQLALEGRRDEAVGAMDAEVLKYGELFIVASNVAEFYAALGDREKALDWLDRAVRAGDERAEWFERDPLLANIRTEPRFRQIVDGIRVRREQRKRK
jgi:tetratricopeptide (TPR) repeat protein